jgi:hypothetical protein
MTRKRRPSSGDPRKRDARVIVTVPGAEVPSHPYPPGAHPGSDVLTVIYPKKPSDTALKQLRGDFSDADVAQFNAAHPAETVSEDVTRDEFMRRLAGLDIIRQVNSDPRNRVIGLAQVDAVVRWWETAR